jgi:hypothetical protein
MEANGDTKRNAEHNGSEAAKNHEGELESSAENRREGCCRPNCDGEPSWRPNSPLKYPRHNASATGSVIGVPDRTIQVNDVYSHACKVQGTTMEKSEEGSACPCKIGKNLEGKPKSHV